MSLDLSERASFTKITKSLPIEPVNLVVEADSPYKYQDLLSAQYLSFIAMYGNRGHSDSIMSGFETVGLILRQIPEAYAELLKMEGSAPNYDELKQALLCSFKRVIDPLAHTDNRRNKTLETWLVHTNPIGNGPSHEFKRYDGLSFAPKIDNYLGAAREILQREESGDLEEKDPKSKCPALAYVLPKLWEVMAINCIERADLFKHDVSAILQQSLPVEV